MIRKERATGTYRTLTAFISKTLTITLLPVCTCLLSIIPLYWMVGLKPSLNSFLLYNGALVGHTIAIAFLYDLNVNKNPQNNSHSLCSLRAIGIGSAVPSPFVGQIIAPLVMLIMVMFGGQFVNVDSIPSWLQWMRFISIVRYSYSALTVNEFVGSRFHLESPVGCYPTGEEVLGAFALKDMEPVMSMGMALLLGSSCLFIASFIFERNTRSIMKLN